MRSNRQGTLLATTLSIALTLAFGGACSRRAITPSEQSAGMPEPTTPSKQIRTAPTRGTDPPAENADEAREDLPAATDELAQQRAEAANAAQRVRQLAAQACAGVPAASTNRCPLVAERVESIRDVDRGISARMTLTPSAGGEETVKRDVECYRATFETHAAEARIAGVPSSPRGQSPIGAPVPMGTLPPAAAPMAVAGECLLDVEGLQVDVDTNGGRVDVELVTDNDAHVEELRRRARVVMSQHRLSAR